MGDFVQVNVSNSQNDVICFEKKFPRDITIVDLKVHFFLFKSAHLLNVPNREFKSMSHP